MKHSLRILLGFVILLALGLVMSSGCAKKEGQTEKLETELPAAVAEATRSSLKIIQTEPQLRERLQQNIRYFRNCCDQTDIQISESKTAIQPIMIGDTEDAVSMSNELFANGILVTAIRPPTVPEGTARLRVTLSAAHNHEQIDKLISALSTIRQ